MPERMLDLREQINEALSMSYLVTDSLGLGWSLYASQEPVRVPNAKEAETMRIILPHVIMSAMDSILLQISGTGLGERIVLRWDGPDMDVASMHFVAELRSQFPFCFEAPAVDRSVRTVVFTGTTSSSKSSLCGRLHSDISLLTLYPPEGVAKFMGDEKAFRASVHRGAGNFSWEGINIVSAWEMYLRNNLIAQINDWIIRSKIASWGNSLDVPILPLNDIGIVMPLIGYCSMAGLKVLPEYVLRFIDIFRSPLEKRVGILLSQGQARRLAEASGDIERREKSFLEFDVKVAMYMQLAKRGYLDLLGTVDPIEFEDISALHQEIDRMHDELLLKLGICVRTYVGAEKVISSLLKELEDKRLFPLFPEEAQPAFYLSYLQEDMLLHCLRNDPELKDMYKRAMLLSIWIFYGVSSMPIPPYLGLETILTDTWFQEVTSSLIIPEGSSSITEDQDIIMSLKGKNYHQYALYTLERILYMYSLYNRA